MDPAPHPPIAGHPHRAVLSDEGRPPDPPALAVVADPLGPLDRSGPAAPSDSPDSDPGGAIGPRASGEVGPHRSVIGTGGRLGAAGPIDGIADRLEAAIVGLETVRAKPGAALGVVVATVALALAAWWLGRPAAPAPVDEAIPMAAGAGTGGTDPAGSPPDGKGGARSRSGTDGPDSAVDPGGGAAGADAVPATTAPDLIVHVAGAVAEPGIVQLRPGARVVDAVDAAGGPTDDADLHQLNLAAGLVDGSQIRVPAQGEAVVQPPAAPLPGTGTAGGTATGAEAPASTIDVNRADATELEALPGIGPALAAAIIEWRDEHGRFEQVDDLLDVPGIGPAKLEALADQVRL